MPDYVVEFAGCREAVIRRGPFPESVRYPDDLGCPPVRVRLLAEVRLRGEPWTKGGQLRCEVSDESE